MAVEVLIVLGIFYSQISISNSLIPMQLKSIHILRQLIARVFYVGSIEYNIKVVNSSNHFVNEYIDIDLRRW